ncbi:hypothetical protein AZH53_04315 [Methanomicrobiaceae archaeon CYW5]|uniref:2'-5' RNA ligase family protein n=1 Tax=Methanovulcanius yangii TaxID=1789227 RepID=UPI0029CA091C|nr:2'-5' RNA ligase family protein [Methanovulcanius yangii]MBT8507642.1 hypothetical protein [Methanovulcanius yangii]
MGFFETIAIDVVLLPPPEVAAAALALNQRLIEQTGDRSIVLDPSGCLPHVSLAMRSIPRRTLPSLTAALDRLALSSLPLDLRIAGAVAVTTESGDVVSGINLEKSEPLLILHRSVMAQVNCVPAEECAPGDLSMDAGEEIAPFTCNYVNGYADQSAYDRYSPHITLGHGDVTSLEDAAVAQTARFSSLAVCHLGNHCTCREILWQRSV